LDNAVGIRTKERSKVEESNQRSSYCVRSGIKKNHQSILEGIIRKIRRKKKKKPKKKSIEKKKKNEEWHLTMQAFKEVWVTKRAIRQKKAGTDELII